MPVTIVSVCSVPASSFMEYLKLYLKFVVRRAIVIVVFSPISEAVAVTLALLGIVGGVQPALMLALPTPLQFVTTDADTPSHAVPSLLCVMLPEYVPISTCVLAGNLVVLPVFTPCIYP